MLSDLRSHERTVHSQGGEDGVLARVFECIGTTNRRFVEFGAWDGRTLSNTALLRLDYGWTGLLMDADPERVTEIVAQERVTAENIEALFDKYDVPRSFDLLSVDIDGNEYWVWDALRSHRPRVVIIEYNVFFGIDVSKTMPYDADHQWDKTMFHGASLEALRRLGRAKGYSLVHTDSYAPNAIFVDDDELPDQFVDPPIERLASWDWAPGAEPPVDDGRTWMVV
jgi:hypothetical protein